MITIKIASTQSHLVSQSELEKEKEGGGRREGEEGGKKRTDLILELMEEHSLQNITQLLSRHITTAHIESYNINLGHEHHMTSHDLT